MICNSTLPLQSGQSLYRWLELNWKAEAQRNGQDMPPMVLFCYHENSDIVAIYMPLFLMKVLKANKTLKETCYAHF